MYLDNYTEYNKHNETIKPGNNLSLNNGEIIMNESKFQCVTCNSALSQYSVDEYLKTQMHLNSFKGKDKDNIITEGPRSG